MYAENLREEVAIIATSSIFHNFVIEGEENVRRLINAFGESMDEEHPPIPDNIRVLRDSKEIEEVLERQCRYLKARRRDYFGSADGMNKLREHIDIFSYPRNPK